MVNGRQWLRELKLAGRMSATLAEESGKGFESDGLRLPDDCVAALQGLDLTRLDGAAPDIMLATPRGGDAHLAPALRAAGALVTSIVFDDFEPLLIDSHSNAAPQHTFATVIAWLSARYPVSDRAGVVTPIGPAVLKLARGSETAVNFGPGLKGVLCRPEAPATLGRAVIFCNTGGDPRAGIGRFAATAARRLVGGGIASLRFDFAGLGDSRDPSDGESHVFATSRAADFDAAVTLLKRMGYTDLTVVGVCSGAYHALRAASFDPRINRLLVVTRSS